MATPKSTTRTRTKTATAGTGGTSNVAIVSGTTERKTEKIRLLENWHEVGSYLEPGVVRVVEQSAQQLGLTPREERNLLFLLYSNKIMTLQQLESLLIQHRIWFRHERMEQAELERRAQRTAQIGLEELAPDAPPYLPAQAVIPLFKLTVAAVLKDRLDAFLKKEKAKLPRPLYLTNAIINEAGQQQGGRQQQQGHPHEGQQQLLQGSPSSKRTTVPPDSARSSVPTVFNVRTKRLI